MSMHQSTGYPTWEEDGIVDWQWITHNLNRRGHHRVDNTWRAKLINNRMVEGDAIGLGHGAWQIVVRCTNDPAKPPPLAATVQWTQGGVVRPTSALIRQWSAMPPV